MKAAWTLGILVLLASCGKSDIPQTDWNKLNGYWEIEQVTQADGKDVDYKGNTVYDFFEVKDSVGRRFKVKPQLDGSFVTHNNVEEFTIRQTDTGTVMLYRTAFSKWNEVLEKLDEASFEVKNQAGTLYRYRKTGPMNLTEDEKKE